MTRSVQSPLLLSQRAGKDSTNPTVTQATSPTRGQAVTPALPERHSATAEPCVHHWILEPADQASGGRIGGACAHCGAVKTFPAHADDYSLWVSGRGLVARDARQPRFRLSDDVGDE
jgi:hypothetical protein